MSVKIWIEASHQPAYRAGGFAWLRHSGEAVSGAAGGARDVDASALAARALASAVKDLPSAAPVVLHLSSADLIEGVREMAARRARGWTDAEGSPLPGAADWAQAAEALAGRGLSLVRTQPRDPRAPASFAAAWAELAREKAKAQGDFQNPIPRPNLAKAPGLPKV